MSSENPAGPLVGIKVLDFSSFIAGCYAAVMLGDLGAEIIKVEPKYGDGSRQWGPFLKGESRFFQAWNRNKRSIALDLKQDGGKEALRALLKTADVLVHNMRPQAIARLGFPYEAVRAIKPDIIHSGCHGYSQQRRYKDTPA